MTILHKLRCCLVTFFLVAGFSVEKATASESTTLTIVTSFPAAFYAPFREAFEKEHPYWRLRIVNRNTSSAIAYIQSGRDDQVDIFWASSPDAFEVLKGSGALVELSPRDIEAPSSIGGYPLNDPAGFYLGFAVSGSGFLWNENYLWRHGLPVPEEWEDLLDPAFHRHIAMTPPSRSGTSHLMLETLLQARGWEEGWAFILKLAGNLATLTARSYSVAESVSRQHVGVGIIIDFLGLSYTKNEDGVHFYYPLSSPFLPANIAILRDSKNREVAEKFVDFVLSSKGQKLLMRDDVQRLPVSMAAYLEGPDNYPNPYLLSEGHHHHIYNGELSSLRYHIVNMIFDELVTFRLSALSATWESINQAESMIIREKNHEAYAKLREAKEALTIIPIAEEEAADIESISKLVSTARKVPPSPSQAKLENELRDFSSRQISVANDLVSQALEILQKT